MLPVIVADVAVTAPACVTLKGADPAVALPTHKRYVASFDDNLATLFDVPTVMFPVLVKVVFPPVRVVDPIVQPPIVPSVDVILPVICADDAVSCPLAFTLKFEADMKNPFPVAEPER